MLSRYGHTGIQQGPDHVGAAEGSELGEDPAVVAAGRYALGWRRRGGQGDRLAPGDREHGRIHGVEVGGGAAGGKQLVVLCHLSGG